MRAHQAVYHHVHIPLRPTGEAAAQFKSKTIVSQANDKRKKVASIEPGLRHCQTTAGIATHISTLFKKSDAFLPLWLLTPFGFDLYFGKARPNSIQA